MINESIIINGIEYCLAVNESSLEKENYLESGPEDFNNGMIGRYVIVRCHDAGVHAGILLKHWGRQCILRDSRRLWYWKPANNKKFLSGIALAGLDESSKVGGTLPLIHLTENCEIILCSNIAAKSIKDIKEDINE